MQRPHLSAPIGAIAVSLCLCGSGWAGEDGCLLFDRGLVLPPGLEDSQHFGRGLATDGMRVAAIAPAGGGAERAVFVLERDGVGGNWFVGATLMPDLGPGVGNAGVHADIDGDRLVIGRSWFDDAKVYVYERGAEEWELVQTILPPEGPTTFGETVQIDGDRLLVGMPSDDQEGTNAGAIAVYRRGAGGGWSLDEVLWLGDAGNTWEQLGRRMHLEGDVLACGVPSRTVGGLEDAGAVVVFEDHGGSFVRTATLLSSEAWDRGEFGTSVSVDGDRIAVGAPGERNNGLGFGEFMGEGRVRVFERDGDGGWGLVFEDGPVGEAPVRVGFSVALEGALLVAGGPFNAWGANPSGMGTQGVVLSFVDDPVKGWLRGEVLLAGEPLPADEQYWEPTDYLGWSVAIVGDEVLAGAPQVTVPGEPYWPMTGGVYVFERPVACDPDGGPPVGPCGPGPAGCASDLTGDGGVDSDDLALLLGGFGAGCAGDVDGDGDTDSDDLGLLLGAFGSVCPEV